MAACFRRIMSLNTQFEKTGAWLFRYRSYLPLILFPMVAMVFISYSYIRHSHQLTELWETFCLMISFSGLAVRALTVGYTPENTSGRNTHGQLAEKLNTTGMYSLVRHPLYLGNYLIILGLSLFFHTWWVVLLVACLFALYYERIMFAEEAFLRISFGEAFEKWATITPSIIPRFKGWQKPPLTFSWRNILRREYSGFFAIILVYFILEVVGDSIVEKRLKIDWPWIVLLLAGTAIYLTLRTLKKQTRLLHVKGR